MSIAKFIAGQLRQPAGFFGRQIMVRVLNRMNYSMNTLALEVLQVTPDDHVLEVGFGGGELMVRMASVITSGKIAGADFSNDVVDICTKRFRRLIKAGRVDLCCANVDKLPFEANTFSKVCTVNTIYFWTDPLIALAQIYRVLKKDGKLVVCFRPREAVKNQNIMQHGFTLYDPEEVSVLLTKAGFRDVQLVRRNHQFKECIAAEGTK
jgi:SAM-dependent methyltransferase